MMLNKLKAWVVSLAQRRTAPHWLGFIAFFESSFFPVPADALCIPMALVRPQKAYHYALIGTLCSTLGGAFGWIIGFYAYDTIAKPILEFYGKYESFQTFQNAATLKFLVILLITSGLFHFPPIKLVTLLSGVMGVPLPLFIVICLLARGARFYLFAWFIRRFGQKAIDLLLRHFTWFVPIGLILLLLVYNLLVYKLYSAF
ncbi:YqaA family protein [Bartonella schoenbuchensis]|uniref:YqaA family protein n=1 Tax=Bartonella schoenbuchensis TaxID=165694 RepID=UPI001ABB18CE|nr:YqaA family protein [Bartonella schoenbuchensis]